MGRRLRSPPLPEIGAFASRREEALFSYGVQCRPAGQIRTRPLVGAAGASLCRVAAGHFCPAAPSEPGVRIAPYPAQAILQHHVVAPDHSAVDFVARRWAKYSCHTGSNGLAEARILMCLVIETVAARNSRYLVSSVPNSPFRFP